MNTKKIFLLLFMFPLLFWNCASEEESGVLQKLGSDEQIKFDIGFADISVDTRVVTSSDLKSKWETNDAIGVYIVKDGESLKSSDNYANNVKLIRQNNGTWKTDNGKEIYYPSDVNSVSFYAYYPYDATLSDPTAYSFSVQTNQITAAGYNKSDLLTAKNENISESKDAVNLQFSHAFSMVQVEVQREINVPVFDDALIVRLADVSTKSMFDLSGSRTPQVGDLTNIEMHKVVGLTNTYRALVPAQVLSEYTYLNFVQTTINMTSQDIAFTELKASNVHKYNVTLGWGIDPNHLYAVGDRYPNIGPVIGVVFEISNGGKNGKIVSLNQGSKIWSGYWQTDAKDMVNGRINMKTVRKYINANNKSWSDFSAFEWVHNKNILSEDYDNASARGVWYLPARDELFDLYAVYDSFGKNNFDSKLVSVGGMALESNWYWSSSENSWYARSMNLLDNNTADFTSKSTELRVRAFLAF